MRVKHKYELLQIIRDIESKFEPNLSDKKRLAKAYTALNELNYGHQIEKRNVIVFNERGNGFTSKELYAGITGSMRCE